MASRFRLAPGPAAIFPLLGLVRRHAAVIVALLPPIFLVIVVVRFAVDVPFLDQWELVPLLEKSYRGSLSFSDVWAQHNEHRILFPRLIMLTLAWLSDWNTYLELGTNVVLALGIFIVYVLQVRATAQELGRQDLTWAIPLASLVVFSVGQYQNWLWGWQLQMFLNVLCVVAGVLVLANGAFNWKKFAAAAASGIGATYAFANGPLFWPIGLLVLLAVTAEGRQRRGAVCIWLVVAVLVLTANYFDYHKPEDHPPLALVFKMPVEYAKYVLKYLGGIGEPGIFHQPAVDGALACLWGLAGVAAFVWAIGRVSCAPGVTFRTLLPYLAMSLYSLGSALGTGVGRVGFGSDQALSSRYCTMVTPFWVSLLVLLILLGHHGARASSGQPSAGGPFASRRRNIARCLLWGFAAGLALGSGSAVARAREQSALQAYGRAQVLHLVVGPIDIRALTALYPQPRIILERLPVLVRYRLSLFRGPR
jgi:hypothetical protein